ncbi:MAG: OmpA family protein [Rhodanobacteraceae bacterium]|nr:OmpA family protein [Rhodanobacteraceae bacterium]
MKSALAFALVLGLSALSPAGSAAPPNYVGENEVPRPIDVARALGGAGSQPQIKKRGIAFDPAAAAAPANLTEGPSSTASAPEAPAAQAVAKAKSPRNAAAAAPPAPAEEGNGAGSMDVAVAFALNSAELQPKALAQLDSIAEGLKLLDVSTTIIIDGHTDSTGPESYNTSLSLQRAQKVQQYLVEHHGIAIQRLQARGKGESHPLDPERPEDARNRRVQFSAG